MDRVLYPQGEADHLKPDYAATIDLVIVNSKTIIEPAILTGSATLDLEIDAEVPLASEVILKIKATGTEVLTLGAGITGPTIVGVAGKTKVQSFVFDGTNFIATGT